MKEAELREHATCHACNEKIGSTGLPIFYTVTRKTYGLDLNATQRQQGLGLMIGGQLAQVMGPDEDLASVIDETEITLCAHCGPDVLMHLPEKPE